METKLRNAMGGKGVRKVVNIVGTIYERISEKLPDKAHGTAVVSSTSCPRSYLLACRRAVEIEVEKAMLVSLSRHDKWKAGGPY